MDQSGRNSPNRNINPGTPYERPRTLLHRVGDSMREMFSPSWLVDLVSSVRRRSRTDSVPQQGGYSNFSPGIAYQSRVSIDMAAANTPYPQGMQPTHPGPSNPSPGGSPQQTMNYNIDGSTMHLQQSSMQFAPASPSMTPIDTQGCRIPYKRHALQRFPNGAESPFREDHPAGLNPRDTSETVGSQERNRSSDVSFLWSDVTRSRQPPSPSHPQPPTKKQRPSFDVSAAQKIPGSPDTSLRCDSRSHNESEFYSGRTTYGGASSVRRLPYRVGHVREQASPAKTRVQATPLNAAGPSTVTSSTAKKILDVLENMSSPLNDAKKIPSYQSGVRDSPLSFTPGTFRKAPAQRKGPPIHNISTPSHNRGLFMQKNTSSGLSQQSAVAGPTQPDRTRHVGGKMMRDRHVYHTRRKGAEHESEDEEETPNLPTDVTLQISNPPKISFGLGVVKPSTSEAITPAASAQMPMTGLFSTPLSSRTSPITSEPVVAKSDTKPSPEGRSQEFTFRSPVDMHEVKSIQSSEPQGFTKNSSYGLKTSSSLIRAKKSAESVVSEVSQPSTRIFKTGGSVLDALRGSSNPLLEEAAQASSELKQGSVLEALIADSSPSNGKRTTIVTKSEESTVPLSDLFKQTSGGWSCPTCMVSNKPDCDKCPCCETPRPKQAAGNSSSASTSFKPTADSSLQRTPSQPATSSVDLLTAVSTQQTLSQAFASGGAAATNKLSQLVETGSWECPTCMVRNGKEKDKCPCCETRRPAPVGQGQTLQNTAPQLPVTANPLSEMFKPATDTWECPTCMIRNKLNDEKCAACGEKNPNKPSSQAADKKPLSDLFKKKEGSWECDTCMVMNEATSLRCAACEAGKPGASAPSTFKNQGGFQFGAINGTTVQFGAAKGFTLAASETSTKPAFSFSNTSSELPKSSGFQFGGPKEGTTTNGPFSLTFGGSTTSGGGTTNTPKFTFGSSSLSQQPVASQPDPGKSTPLSSGYTFGLSSAAKDSSGLPGPTTSRTSATTNDTSCGVTSASHMSSGFSLRGTTAATTTTAALKTAPTVPTFNFGSNLQTPTSGESAAPKPAETSVKVPQFNFGNAPQTSNLSSNQDKDTKSLASQPNALPFGGAGGQSLFTFGKTTATPATSQTAGQGSSDSTAFRPLGVSATQATASSSAGFTFGQPNQSKPSTSKSDQPAATPGFGFGALSAPQSGATGFTLPTSASLATTGATNMPQPPGLFTFSGSKPASFTGTPGLTNGPTTSNGTSLFQFGGSKNVASSSSAPMPFGFGQSSGNGKDSSVQPSSNLTFGQSTKPDVTGNALPSASASFNFGTPGSGAFSFTQRPSGGDQTLLGKRINTEEAGTEDKKVKEGTMFGALAGSTSSVFGAPSGSTSSVFGGTPSVPSFGGTNNTSGFNFGASSSSTGFNFQQNNNTVQPLIQFKGNNAAPAGNTGASNTGFNFSATPNFGFAQNNTPVQFSGAPPAANPFDATGGGGAPRRPIKQARRRLQPKK